RINPVLIATIKIEDTNIITNFFLKNLLNKTTSGILAPAPPIKRAITEPIPIPLLTRASPIGKIASARMYIGIPTMEAIGIVQGLSPPAYLTINSCGIRPARKAKLLLHECTTGYQQRKRIELSKACRLLHI